MAHTVEKIDAPEPREVEKVPASEIQEDNIIDSPSKALLFTPVSSLRSCCGTSSFRRSQATRKC